MNRTIKFRGKRLDNGKWVYGNLLQICGGYIIYHGSPTESDEFEDDGKTAIYLYKNEASAVHPNTIGQFTGLLDRNGKEIYEGDIVRIRENIGLENVGVVVFIDGCFFVEVEKSEAYTFRHALHIKNSVWKDMNANIPIEYEYEVLGNIHDNPELLTSTKP